MEKDESLPATFNSPLQQESDTSYQPSAPLNSATSCNDTPDPDLSGDYYRTRNRLLDNTSVQSFEETLYLGASKPLESTNDSCSNEKITDAANEIVECNDQQTIESEVTKIAEEW